jgi:hypothetical protein
MIDADKANFKSLMESSMSIYNVEIDINVLKIWWAALQRMSFDHVSEAFSRYIQDPKLGKFAPKPADILGIFEAMNPDGRIGADEAWALYPHNEWASAVITDEMAEAMGIAQSLMNSDEVAARMAFKEAYNRITNNNKFNGIPPKWFPSLGHNVEAREPVIKEAVEKGRLTQQQYLQLCPPKADKKVIDSITELRQLTDKSELTPEQKERNSKRMEEIRALLRNPERVVD